MTDAEWLTEMNRFWKDWTLANKNFMPNDFQGTVLLYQAFLSGLLIGVKYQLETTLTGLAE